MKNKLLSFFNFGLRFPWNIHVRIVLFCIIGSFVFWAVAGNGSFRIFYAISFLIMFFDAEIFFWISRMLFRSFKYESRKAFIWLVIQKVSIFFVTIMVLGTLVASLVIVAFQMQWQESLRSALDHLFQYEIKGIILSLLIASVLATLAFFVILWLKMMNIVHDVRQQMLVYQSETLKNQVNPHFLFNSLNTLSSLISSKPEKAEQFTQKLSDIYRYILEKREADTVLLQHEMDFVNDFYFLQKLRDEDKIELQWHIENKQCRIVPISLQLLVENAFKHNTATHEKPLVVSITQHHDRIIVCNPLIRKKQLDNSGGTGLSNLSKRISLLTGKEMKIDESDSEFVVTIPLLCNE